MHQALRHLLDNPTWRDELPGFPYPFASLEIPFLPWQEVSPLYDGFVLPFYNKPLSSFDRLEKEAFARIRDRITDELITTLLSDLNWRSKTAAAYFAIILDRPAHIDHMGHLLLRSDVCHAGRAYSLAMAHFRTEAAIGYLNRYLDYYLDRTDLHFDQTEALAALRHIDKLNHSHLADAHSGKINRMLAARPDFLKHVSESRIAGNLSAATNMRHAGENPRQ